MTAKSKKPYRTPGGVEVGIYGSSGDTEFWDSHLKGIRQGQIAQAKRRSEGHEDGCKCGDCLWLDEIGERP